jgi:hypothetical protein
MTVHDDDRPGDDGVHPATPARRSRGLVVAGVIGLAAVLGGGSYLITDHLRGGDDKGATTSIGRIDSVETSDAPSAEASAPASTQPSAAAAPASATAAPSPAPAATLTSPTDAAKVKKEIQAAREKAAKDGYPLQRPLQDKGQPVEADTRMEKYAGGTMRITTAKGDLTGQKDQLMAGDAGVPVGAARCTSKLRFANADKPREIPTVVLCWQTSAKRSVVTMAVADKGGKPSSAAVAAVIAREWAKLG